MVGRVLVRLLLFASVADAVIEVSRKTLDASSDLSEQTNRQSLYHEIASLESLSSKTAVPGAHDQEDGENVEDVWKGLAQTLKEDGAYALKKLFSWALRRANEYQAGQESDSASEFRKGFREGEDSAKLEGEDSAKLEAASSEFILKGEQLKKICQFVSKRFGWSDDFNCIELTDKEEVFNSLKMQVQEKAQLLEQLSNEHENAKDELHKLHMDLKQNDQEKSRLKESLLKKSQDIDNINSQLHRVEPVYRKAIEVARGADIEAVRPKRRAPKKTEKALRNSAGDPEADVQFPANW